MSVVTDGQTPQLQPSQQPDAAGAAAENEELTRWMAFAGVGIGLSGWLLSRRGSGRGLGQIFTLLTFGSALMALVAAVRGLFSSGGAGAGTMDYPAAPFGGVNSAPSSSPSYTNTPASIPAPSLQPITVVETKADNVELGERPKLPTPASKLKPIQGFLFIGALIVSGALLLWLPPREAGILLIVMVVAALAVAGYSMRQPMSGIGLELTGFRNLAAYYAAAAVSSFNRSRRRNAFIFTTIAVLLMLQATALFEWRGLLDDSRLYDATRVAALGAFFLGAAWLLSPARALMPLFSPAKTTFVSGAMTAVHWGAVGISIVMLAVLAEISGLKFFPDLRVPMHIQFATMVSAMILLAWGLSAAPLPTTFSWAWTRNREVWLVVALTIAALALRFYQLGEVQWRSVDEILFVDNLKRMWGDPSMPMLQPMGGLTPFTWIYTYWQVPLVSLFGRNLFGLRAASVIIGALNVPALYFLMRVCFGKRVALLSALLLVGFPPHVHFSRISLNQVVDTLFGVLALGFMARAMKHNRRSDYVIGGVLLGFTQYHYEGGRLFFPLLTIAWLGGITVLWLRRMITIHWKGLALTIISAVIVALPAYYTLWALDIGFTNRVNVTGLGPSYLLRALGDPLIFQDLLKRISDTFHVIVHKPEASMYYGGPGPLLLNFMVPFFLLGLAYCLWQVRKPGAMLVLGWVATTMAGNALLIDTTHMNHYEIGFPALTAVTGIGIWAMIRLLLPGSAAEDPSALPDKPQRKIFGIRQRRFAGALAAVIGVAFTVMQVNYYFNVHLPYYNEQTIGNERDGEDVAIRMANFPVGTLGVIVSPSERLGDWRSMLAFYKEGLDILHVRDDEFAQDYIDHINRAVDYAFFIAPQDDHARELLAANFDLPEPQYTTRPVGPEHELVMYYIPADPAAVAAAEAEAAQQ